MYRNIKKIYEIILGYHFRTFPNASSGLSYSLTEYIQLAFSITRHRYFPLTRELWKNKRINSKFVILFGS